MVSRSARIASLRTRAVLAVSLLIPLVAIVSLTAADTAGATVTLPAKFEQRTAVSGLTQPTGLAFSPDGRIFIAEKSGLVKVFDPTTKTTAIYADLRAQVMNYWDRGMLGIALHPNFPTDPRIYVSYTYNPTVVVNGKPVPKWPSNDGGTTETCPSPPGPTTDGCVVLGRISVLSPANPSGAARAATGVTERVLIEDWCQQFPSHSMGSLKFGPDGMLYGGGGDGASFGHVDYGQTKNPCGDPPTKAGTSTTAPKGEGGALRAQDLRSPNDPTTLDGGLIRINPETGAPATGNPNAAGHDVNARRLISEGQRNSYRFTFRPGTREIWIGDVGMKTWEEINRIPSPTAKVTNFGWPCYEGTAKMPGYDAANLTLCEGLYKATAAATKPYYTYKHGAHVVAGDPCGYTSSSIAGLAFYPGGPGTSYPLAYKGALFFTDYSRKCVWAMMPGTNGLPDPTKIRTFASGLASGLVDLQAGPDGDIYGVDIGTTAGTGEVLRYVYNGVNNPPQAAIAAVPPSGDVPLTVAFDASGSTDVNPNDLLTYRWDLDGDGTWDEGLTGPKVSKTYDTKAKIKAKVEVTDDHGGVDTAETLVTPGYSPPTVTITSPTPDTTWKVNDTISFSATATDPQDGALTGDKLDWTEIIHHCPANNCHEHVITHYYGESGSFSAPDHEYPSHLELRLTATDSDGLSTTRSVNIYPQTVQLRLATSPAGGTVGFVDEAGKSPLERPEIIGSTVSISAPQPQVISDQVYRFGTWTGCDPAASTQATHDITAPAVNTTCTANLIRKTNLALQRPVKVSSASSATYAGSKAVDGSMSTRWSSARSSPQWLQVDLGSTQKVGRAILRWEAAYGKAYKIQVSGDAKTWTTVFTTASGNGGVDNIVFTPRNARYVQFYGTTRATKYGYSPWEFEIYDS
ncbi:MAG: hypothetical protein JWN52_3280 [Actinomycetia bacterium]|nr:hypothetical protein [Actinomycetes bacterium]